jgi:mitochondrial enoyl-[acyl-carrier protein] reductase / trans-2-enoyl-CoA reductase
MFQIYRKLNLKSINKVRYLSIQVKELKLKDYATSNEIENCLELTSRDLNVDSLKTNELLVKLIASPINPADINIIQGKYGILPKSLPSIVGNEGLFQVVKSNDDLNEFKPGDWVLPNQIGWGTWRSSVIDSKRSFIKLPNLTNLNKEACSTIAVNPVTALIMLKSFKDLKPNDTVIQNGANSAVGQAVNQLCKLMNVNVVNIVRKRPDLQQQNDLIDFLHQFGAKYIFTEDDLRKQVFTDLWQTIPKPKLALNCVGGKPTVDMIRHLDYDSTIVTYGGMSRQPLSFNIGDFIFKDLKSVGFWVSRWRQKNPIEYRKTIDYICELISKGQFKHPKCEQFSLNDYKKAFKRYQTPFINSKILFVE